LQAGEYRIYTNKKFQYPYATGEEDADRITVSVTPNPVSDKSVITVKFAGTSRCEIQDFMINGSENAKVYSGTITDQLTLPWTPETKGLHILRITVGNSAISHKVIVK